MPRIREGDDENEGKKTKTMHETNINAPDENLQNVKQTAGNLKRMRSENHHQGPSLR